MSKPTIIFIINSVQQQRCIKRINEFMDNGYPVKAYGFSRLDVVPTKPERFTIEVLVHLTNGANYFSRLLIMRDELREVFATYKGKDVVYYYFMLDVAMACRSLSHAPFIYEESDLAHTTLRKPIIAWILERVDRHVIRRSILTVFTSEGFVRYHFGNTSPTKCVVVPNRLNSTILSLPLLPQHTTDMQHLQIGFVGGARYKSILRFAETIAHRFPQHTFHFFGTLMSELDRLEKLKSYPNIVFHGAFANPKDLPEIYSKIDLLRHTMQKLPMCVLQNQTNCMKAPISACQSLYRLVPFLQRKCGHGASVTMWMRVRMIQLQRSLTHSHMMIIVSKKILQTK